jgi:hypothetical protein
MIIPHRKHICILPRPVTGIALFCICRLCSHLTGNAPVDLKGLLRSIVLLYLLYFKINIITQSDPCACCKLISVMLGTTHWFIITSLIEWRVLKVALIYKRIRSCRLWIESRINSTCLHPGIMKSSGGPSSPLYLRLRTRSSRTISISRLSSATPV